MPGPRPKKSDNAPIVPSASATEDFPNLRCLKCLEGVTLENSHASGRNPLKRICGGCSSTDRALQRCVKTKSKGDKETDEEKEHRSRAEKIEAEVSKMNEQARAEWYQKEKKKRETEGAGKRRTFERAVGIITEEKIRSKERDDMTNWVRFREWAATERMVTGCEPDMLETRWKEEIQKPGNQTMIVKHSSSSGLVSKIA